MKVAKTKITDPRQNSWYVVPGIAVSLFIFAYSVLFGQISILVLYGIWFGPLLVSPRMLLVRPTPVLLLLVVPTLFFVSTIWSDVPSTTLRASIQYGTTILCGLVAARITSAPNLALGGTIGGLFIMLYSAANMNYAYDFIDGSYALTGAFASKNQLGYYATLTMLFGMSLIWLYRSPFLVAVVAGLTTLIALTLLIMSDSATSILSAAAAFGAILSGRVLVALTPSFRWAALSLLVSSMMAALVAAYQLGAFNAVLAAFGKDSTLTGRTYLWNQAIEIGNAHPILGLGYNAFWVHDRIDAERLWEEFYITGRTGFHFHNLMMETYVGLGFLGVFLVAIVCVMLFVMPVRALMTHSASGSVMMCSGLAVLFLTRSVAEVDFITAYTAGTFLVTFVLTYLSDHIRGAKSASRRHHMVMPSIRFPAKRQFSGGV